MQQGGSYCIVLRVKDACVGIIVHSAGLPLMRLALRTDQRAAKRAPAKLLLLQVTVAHDGVVGHYAVTNRTANMAREEAMKSMLG